MQVVEIPQPWKARSCLPYVGSTLVADEMVPQGDRASASMVLA